MVLPSGMAIRVINEDTTSTKTAASTTSGSEENKGSQHRKRKSTGAKAAGASQPIPKVSYEVLSRPHQMGPPLPNHQALPCHPFKMPHPLPLPQVPPIPTSGSYQQWTNQVRFAHIFLSKQVTLSPAEYDLQFKGMPPPLVVRPPGMYNLHPGGGPMNPPLVPPLPPVSAAPAKPKGRRTSAAGKVKKVKAEKVPRKLLQQQHQLSWQQHVAQIVRQDTIF